jgi:hypothetical protein
MVDSQSAFKLLFFDLPTYPQLAHFPPLPLLNRKRQGWLNFPRYAQGGIDLVMDQLLRIAYGDLA